jgi:UDP-galactopyranose mutase
MLNIKAQHLGLYIYSKQTLNRWYINSLYLYDQEIDIENKEDIDDTWHNLVSEAIDNLNHQIQTLEDKKTRINMLYQDIHKNYRNRQWDTQIQELKKIIQNIIF